MRRLMRIGLAAAMAAGVSLAAGHAGATYNPTGYQQCLAAGNAECYTLHGSDPDAYNQCIAVFYENCRIHWEPDPDPCEKGAPNPEDCPIIN